MNKSRFQIAKPDIIRFFDELPSGIHRSSDIDNYLTQQRGFWRLAQDTSTRKFIKLLMESGLLFEIIFPFPAPYRRTVRYTWGKVSLYEVAQTLKPGCYFSHYTAVKFHGLTEQLPKTTYLTVEQFNSSQSSGVMTQESITRAFRNKARESGNVAKSDDFRVCVVAGRNTGKLGVIEGMPLPDTGVLRYTSLERTLIDIAVRPVYAGGVFEVAKAFELSKDRVSVNALAAMLKNLRYTYPYHQAIGYYLERAGYKPALVNLLKQIPMNFDFYLDYKMDKTDYVGQWRLFIPKGF